MRNKQFLLFSLGFGSIVGVSWSVTLNNLLVMGGGPVPVIMGFVVSALLMIPIALCFAELVTAIPVAGGIIAYAYKGFGEKTSFIGGWFLSIAYLSILPWEAIAINSLISSIFPYFNEGRVLYVLFGENIYLRSLIISIVISLAIISLNWKGINISSASIFLLLICASVSAVALLFKFNFNNFTPLYQKMPEKSHYSFFTGFIAVIAMSPFYYSGFDTIPQSIEDAGKGISPKKIGFIIIKSLLAAGLFYSAIVFFSGGSNPWLQTLSIPRPVFPNLIHSLYTGAIGEILFWISMLGTFAGLFSAWNGFFVASSHLLLAMGRARFLPPIFAKKNAKGNASIGGLLLCAAITLTGPFLGAGVFDTLLLLGSASFVLGWFLVCFSAFRLRIKEPDLERPYCMPMGKLISLFGMLASGFIVCNCVFPFMPGYMGVEGVCALIIWIAIGLILYSSTKSYRNQVDENQRMKALFLSKKEPEGGEN